MAGFVKDAKYDWAVKDCNGEVYVELRKYLAKQAYQIFNDMKKEQHGLRLYCNGKLVSE